MVDDGIRVPEFPFSSPLASKAMALERLRGDLPRSVEHLPVLAELGDLYRLISSIVSARIEGNRTTILDAVDGARRRESTTSEPGGDSVNEILRLLDAAELVDRHVQVGTRLTHALIRTLHETVTRDLRREGDPHPGSYRDREVAISASAHVPPLAQTVHAHMTQLLDFGNAPAEPHLQLVRMAVAHHRFVWIHPFANGNGRVARLFSYAMIRAYGFAPEVGYPTANPTTVFGADRQGYYDRLAAADSLEDGPLVEWADFVLAGLLRDMSAIRDLARPSVMTDLLTDAVDSGRRAGILSAEDAGILRVASHGGEFRAGDLVRAVSGAPSKRSVAIRSLLERDLIRRERDGGRIYRIRLTPNPLTPFVIGALGDRGLLPAILEE